MKRIWCLVLLVALLCGCSSERLVETVCDDMLLGSEAPPKELSVKLPADASKSVLTSEDGGQLYFCDDYLLTVQTRAAGDLDRTFREICGYGEDQLTVIETKLGNTKRYDWTWTSAGEGGVQVGRAAMLDDGEYHYCVTVMADEADCGNLDPQWDTLFAALTLKY